MLVTRSVSLITVIVLAVIALVASVLGVNPAQFGVPPSPDPLPEETFPEFDRVIQFGDSYSAGFGVLSAQPAAFDAYLCSDPHYFDDEVTPGIRLGNLMGLETFFAGCGGAEAHTKDANLDFRDQLEIAHEAGLEDGDGDGALIVLTIGGNDLRYKGDTWPTTLTGCLMSEATDCEDIDVNGPHFNWNTVFESTRSAHSALMERYPKATVRVMGYPTLLGELNSQGQCELGPATIDGVDIDLNLSATEVTILNNVNDRLNEAVQQSVDYMANPDKGFDIQMVETSKPGRDGACRRLSGRSLVNSYEVVDGLITANSFHPTPFGYYMFTLDLAENMGIDPYALEPVNPQNETCEFAPGREGLEADPWRARIGYGINLREAGSSDMLSGPRTRDVDHIQVIVDMLGFPVKTGNYEVVGSAGELPDIEVWVEQPGGQKQTVALEPYCYDNDNGTSRGYYTASVPVSKNQPFTSIVAHLRDDSGNLVGSSARTVASVDNIATEPITHGVGIRINESGLNEIEKLADRVIEETIVDFAHQTSALDFIEVPDSVDANDRDLIEQALEEVPGIVTTGHNRATGDIEVLDIDIDTTLTPLAPTTSMPAGGFRLNGSVDSMQMVVAGIGDCNYRIELQSGFSVQYDLILGDKGEGIVATNEIQGFGNHENLKFKFRNAATYEYKFCASRIIGLVLPLFLQDKIDEAIEEGIPQATELSDILASVTNIGDDRLDGVLSIDSFGSNGSGLYMTASVALPVVPVPGDQSDQTIETSVQYDTTSSGQDFDAALLLDPVLINRSFAVGARIAAGAMDPITAGGYQLSLAPLTAPYVLRGNGTNCGTMCLDVHVPPMRTLITDGNGEPSDIVLITLSKPIQASFSPVEGGIDYNLDLTGFSYQVTPLWSADGQGQMPADWGSIVMSLLGEGLPAMIRIDEFTPELIQMGGYSTALADMPGNNDFQATLDLDFSAPTYEIPTCFDRTATIWGTPGDDVIIATPGKVDVIVGLGGNDLIEGGNKDDFICGGPGDDMLDGEQGRDHILGGDGDDYIFGGNFDDKIWGSDGDDTINGFEGDDQIWGGDGNDLLLGHNDGDELYGEHGDDTLYGGKNGWFESDKTDGGQGTDKCYESENRISCE